MNRSIVVTRYATALVKYTRESGHGDIVCSEAESLIASLATCPDLRHMLEAGFDVVTGEQKKKLLETALGGSMSDDMSRFVALLIGNGRIDMLQDILRSFVDLYLKSKGIRKARLVTATQAPDSLIERLKELVKSKTGYDVIIKADVDPSIIGGFVFDIEDSLMDASVKRQLDIVREQFIERNRRII